MLRLSRGGVASSASGSEQGLERRPQQTCAQIRRYAVFWLRGNRLGSVAADLSFNDNAHAQTFEDAAMTDAHDTDAMVDRAVALVTELLRKRGRETGANLGHALRREATDFSPTRLGFESLTRMLLEAADGLVVVGRAGDDRIWAIGDDLSDQDLDGALASDSDEVASTDNATVPNIDRIRLENFRSCRNVDLRLADAGLTLLVGPNGSGKTTLLLGASYASQATSGRLRAIFSGPRRVARLRSSDADGAMALTIGAEHVSLRLEAIPGGEDTRFTVTLLSQGGQETWTSPGPRPSPPLQSRPASQCLRPSVLLRFRAEALARPSDVVEGQPRPGFDGSGLPTVLAHLATTDPERLDRVVSAVRKVVPAVRRTRQRLRKWEPRQPAVGSSAPQFQYVLEVEMDGDGWVPADMLSEGTLFAFGMHTVLHQPRPPRLLLMDDIDRGLHPSAQRMLIQQIAAIAADGGPSIVASTHSPYILDEVPPESVRVVYGSASGTRVRALVDHPEWQEWTDHMTAGEFWTYVGEDWLEQSC